MTTIGKILGEPVAEPRIGEIRKAVCVIMSSGEGWASTYSSKYYWNKKTANKAHPRLLKPKGGYMGAAINAHTIRVVWTGKCWNIIGQAVRPK